jgi:hypothetical protein
MPKYIVEFTSDNPHEPRQEYVMADDPLAAVEKARREHPYGHPTLAPWEGNPSYEGWQKYTLTISVSQPRCEHEECWNEAALPGRFCDGDVCCEAEQPEEDE